MNKTTHKIVSCLILLVSIFGLLAGSFGIKDALTCMNYLQGDGGDDPVAMLSDGIQQLSDNETAYNEGIVQYKDGLVQLADGEVQLADGKAQLAQGYKDYADGEKQLADGRKQLAEGQKMIDDNTAAYNEGKELLAKIDPIMPYVDQYIAFRDGTIAKLPGFETAQEWFMSVVRPLMKELGLFDIPDDVKDLPKYIQDMVADGKAQLKMYEDGLVQLADGKKQLADGEKQLADGAAQLRDGEAQVADGEQQLADGKKQLKEGRAQLKMFEDGMGQIADGLDEVLSQQNYVRKDGTVVVASPADKLGEDFDYLKYNKDGSKIEMLDETKEYVDMDKATEVRDVLADYVEDVTNAATKEIVSRVVLSVVLILGSIAGLIAGLRGLLKTKGFIPGVIAAVAGVGTLIGGIATKFNDYVFLAEGGSCNGKLQMAAIILFALVSLCFAIVTYFTRDKSKKEKKAKEEVGEDVKVAKD